MRRIYRLAIVLVILVAVSAMTAFAVTQSAGAQGRLAQRQREADLEFPPKLPNGKEFVSDTSDDFLKATDSLLKDVKIAKIAPTIDFAYFPGQNYLGKPWSAWGDSLAANGKYYASIGDHLAPRGNAFVYEFDPSSKQFRQLCDVTKLLDLPKDHYTPGKIHSRLDMGSDGWIYFSTHRGSARFSNDANHFKGEWIIRCDPKTGKSEIVAEAPVAKHCIPNSSFDPQRLIFYGGTAAGSDAVEQGIQFFAYDVGEKKLIYAGKDGPGRYMMFAKSTGLLYYTPELQLEPLFRFDPDVGKPVQIPGRIGIRAATEETPDGKIYTASKGGAGEQTMIYEFDTKTEKARELGPAAVGNQQYVASLDADPSGRYLYYVPGAHGGSPIDGTPLVQFDTKTSQKKVIAFFDPFYQKKYGCTLKGTFSAAVDASGEKVFITWNVSRGSRAWDCTALTVVHIPEGERKP